MRHLLLACFLSSFSFLQAQELNFDWYEGSCLFNAKIDSSKANYQQVQNVHYTLIQASDLSQPFLAYAPKDTAYLKVKNIQFECGNFLKELDQMEYPKGEYWTNIKKMRLANLKEQCLLREKAVIALNQPKVLKGTPYCKDCSQYVTALDKGGKTLLNLWKEMHDKEVAEALDPEPIIRSFEQRWNSSDQELWARIEVLRYGWWNCVLENQKLWFDEKQYHTEFKKLMSSIKSDCH
ncbi:MAG: hypothetical protein K0S23_1673 [Fluviicola sp.]|jgi:hypothetical protein|uniref:hypothetical protein n=1 Tax=Fluviicola sp. TaxID=1917219 RepID=UPI0026346BB0|nr:hypothetical protein [Fluviicola sp.]MDF3027366.1 hypothetical protein [Fluviicola sp.]